MAGLDYSYVGIVSALVGVVGYLLGWISNPWNKAFLMRYITKKNWVVVVIRTLGGQIKVMAYKLTEPIIKYQNMSFLPHDLFAVYKGSIPSYFFSIHDAKGVPFGLTDDKTEEVNAKFRDPKYLNALFLQVKAVYETMGLTRFADMEKKINWTFMITLVIVLGLILVFVHVENTGQMLAGLVRQGATVAQGLVNQLG